MSIESFEKTWTVVEGRHKVKKGQCIKIGHKPGGDKNALAFTVPYPLGSTKHLPFGVVRGFGDGGWPDVKLRYESKGNYANSLIGTATVGDGCNRVFIRPPFKVDGKPNGRERINCLISRLDSSVLRSAARRILVDIFRYLRAAGDVDEIPRAAISWMTRYLQNNSEIYSLDSSALRAAAKRIFAEFSRYLPLSQEVDEVSQTAVSRIAELLYELGNSFEEVGEWEAEDDGG